MEAIFGCTIDNFNDYTAKNVRFVNMAMKYRVVLLHMYEPFTVCWRVINEPPNSVSRRIVTRSDTEKRRIREHTDHITGR